MAKKTKHAGAVKAARSALDTTAAIDAPPTTPAEELKLLRLVAREFYFAVIADRTAMYAVLNLKEGDSLESAQLAGDRAEWAAARAKKATSWLASVVDLSADPAPYVPPIALDGAAG